MQVGQVIVNGNIPAWDSLLAFLKDPVFESIGLVGTGLLTAQSGGITFSTTNVSETPGTVRAINGAEITGVSLTSGNLVGSRGSVTITNGTNVGNDVFLYGAQGKVISGTGVIDAGSGHVAGMYGQLDLTGGTTTSGHIAAVIADIFNPGATGANVDCYYAEQTTGTKVNSVLKAIVNANYLFDLSDVGNASWDLATNPSTLSGCLKIHTDAGVRYIPVYTNPTGG